MPKLGPKMPDFGIFDQKCLIWVFLGQNFKRNVKKQKCLNLGPKIPDIGIFGLEFENNIVMFEISTLEFV